MATHDAGTSPNDSATADPAQQCVDYFASGLNCAESVLRGLNESYDLELPPSAYGIATPFGGGFGGARSSCGALTGGLMVLGLARGRSDASESAGPGSQAGRELHTRFLAEFNTTCCCDLTSNFEWTSPERRSACQAYVQFTAQAVTSILDDRDAGAR